MKPASTVADPRRAWRAKIIEAENKISTARVNDVIKVSPTLSVDGGDPVMLGPTLKGFTIPEPEETPCRCSRTSSSATP